MNPLPSKLLLALVAVVALERCVIGNCAAVFPEILARGVERVSDSVKRGRTVAASMAEHPQFPALAVHMVRVGEETGRLEEMLLKTAETFEQETAQVLDRMLAALVPAITLVLAAVVGVVIIAVLVPLYDLTGAIN